MRLSVFPFPSRAAATALSGGQARNEVENSSSVLEKANLAL